MKMEGLFDLGKKLLGARKPGRNQNRRIVDFLKQLFFCAKKVADDIKREQEKQERLQKQQQQQQQQQYQQQQQQQQQQYQQQQQQLQQQQQQQQQQQHYQQPHQQQDLYQQPQHTQLQPQQLHLQQPKPSSGEVYQPQPHIQAAPVPEPSSWSSVAQQGGGPPAFQHQDQSSLRPPQRPPHGETPSSVFEVRTDPSQEELNDFSAACNHLWAIDLNRLKPNQDYVIDVQGGTRVQGTSDAAASALFRSVSEDVFRRPTFAHFRKLLDNYIAAAGTQETETEEDLREQRAFIDELVKTAPVQYLHKVLIAKKRASPNVEDFKRDLQRLWFQLYGRGGGRRSSSAFEHVFVGELKQGPEGAEVSGFHNWIQFYLEERKGKVDYRGFIFPRRRGPEPDSETQLLTIKFAWNDTLKDVSSTLVGVSPEFELALYTFCFYLGREDNRVTLGPYNVNVKCYCLGPQQDKIGSVFPICED